MNTEPTPAPQVKPHRSWPKRILRLALWLVILLVVAVVARGYFAFRDRLPGYSVAVDIDGAKALAQPQPLKAGFAKVNISPDMSLGAPPVYIAGFSQNRTATRIHDDLWAIACVLDDGTSRIGLVALDAIGFFQDDVARVRGRLQPELKLDYAIICSTHNHSTPDLMGLWGPDILHTGVNKAYREKVIESCAGALAQAVAALQPARVAFHEIRTEPVGLLTDTRKPDVYDCDLRVMHFLKAGTSETLGSIVNWGNHPETPWSKNTEVTSDFCGYLRDALEKGVEMEGRRYADGLGGTHLYINGAVGGLMSTTPSVTVRDPFTGRDYQQPCHEKARALGHQLFSRIMPELSKTNAAFSEHLPISVRARTLNVPLANNGYLLAGFLGLIDRGYVKWRTLRTEVALLTFGEASLACVPGEIYPEIVNGGVETPDGADFAIQPVEVPPIRELMPGKIKFICGLANDEIGYILPKSQWDEKPPYTYGAKHRLYGEVNSVGPEAGPIIHQALRQLAASAKPEKSP